MQLVQTFTTRQRPDEFSVIGASCQKYNFCRDKTFVRTSICRDKHNFVKHAFVATKDVLRRAKHMLVATKDVLRRAKHMFVATKDVLCRAKYMLVATNTCLSRQKTCFVVPNTCLSRQKLYLR